jgi:outer membrane protein W
LKSLFRAFYGKPEDSESQNAFFFDQTHQRHPTQKSTLPCTYFVYPNWSMSLMAQRRQKKNKNKGKPGKPGKPGKLTNLAGIGLVGAQF